MKLSEQTNLTAQLIIGTRQVKILTGRRNRDGTPEVLLRSVGKNDRDAIRRMREFLDYAIEERGLTPAR